ncbi:MAG: hypothetical protein AB7U05_17200 [Mangrovibacterium sp.]
MVELTPKASFTLEEMAPFVAPELNRLGVESYGYDVPRQLKILLAKKIVGTNQFKGVPVNWDTFIQNMELPDTGLAEQAIREARVKISIYDSPSPLAPMKVHGDPLAVLEVEKNTVRFKAGIIEAIQDNHKHWIETEDQAARLQRAQKLAEALNEIVEAGAGTFILADPGDIGFIVELDKHGFFKPSWGYVNAEW